MDQLRAKSQLPSGPEMFAFFADECMQVHAKPRTHLNPYPSVTPNSKRQDQRWLAGPPGGEDNSVILQAHVDWVPSCVEWEAYDDTTPIDVTIRLTHMMYWKARGVVLSCSYDGTIKCSNSKDKRQNVDLLENESSMFALEHGHNPPPWWKVAQTDNVREGADITLNPES